MKSRRIPFSNSNEWQFINQQSKIVRNLGRFFRIVGVSFVQHDKSVDLPLIDQWEIGILGFIVTNQHGKYRVLFQAKAEPGNIGEVQLAPTVQATESNYSQHHGGKPQPFLEYFRDKSFNGGVLVHNSLQTEQGWRFYKKRNRNIVIEVHKQYEVPDTFKWVDVEAIPNLLCVPHLLNSDSRSVLLGFYFEKWELLLEGQSTLSKRALQSLRKRDSSSSVVKTFLRNAKHTIAETYIKPLNELVGWHIYEKSIERFDKSFFKVVQIEVRTNSREVTKWDQPIISTRKIETVMLIAQEYGDSIRFLVKFEAEPGLFRKLGVTVPLLTNESYDKKDNATVVVLNWLTKNRKHVVYNQKLVNSEEGGRFYRDANNQKLVILDENSSILELPINYYWMTLSDLKELLLLENVLTNELRSALCALIVLVEKENRKVS